jgi:large subunit ribosomal protein L14
MKGLTANVTRGIMLGTMLNCADNTGAKKMEMIGVRGFKGKHRRNPSAGIGDVIMCSVKKGTEKLKKTVVYAVIVRQKKEYRRIDGTRIKFEDNAAVLVNSKTLEPQGTEIRSAVAREVIERFTPIGKISSIVV